MPGRICGLKKFQFFLYKPFFSKKIKDGQRLSFRRVLHVQDKNDKIITEVTSLHKGEIGRKYDAKICLE